MSHNSKYYTKKIPKPIPGKTKTVDFFFKQALLNKETPSTSNIPPIESPPIVTGNESQCITSSSVEHVENSSSSSEDEGPSSSVLVPDFRLFALPKYEARYSWLYYSASKEGYCCKLCELFASTDTSNVFITGTKLGTHPTRKLVGHETGKCHQFCISKFIAKNTNDQPQKVKRTVADMLQQSFDTKQQEEVTRNRLYIQSLLKTLYFLSRQRWAMNSFDTLVDFMISMGATDMGPYIEAHPQTKYTSSTTCTELLTAINFTLEQDLLRTLRCAPYYALLADESTDEAHREQFAILVRFPHLKTVTDYFLGVVQVEHTDAASLMSAVEVFLLAKNVDIKKAMFVGFDGCNTMSGENTGLQRRFRHHAPHQLYINCRNHKLALCIKHLMASFPVLENVDSLLLSIWKLFHYSPQKYAIFLNIQSAYGMKTLKLIRAAATRWLSHGHACTRLMERYVQVLDALDAIMDKKYDPEIDGVRNMLCAKNTVAGILVLCDILEPVIGFSNYLQLAELNFSHVQVKLQELITTLHLLVERFRNSLHRPDQTLNFSRLQEIFTEIDDRTVFQRRLRDQGAFGLEQIVEEIAVPVTHHLIHELEDSFLCSPVLASFSVFSLENVPDTLLDLDDYGKQEIQVLAKHYGTVAEDEFKGHKTEANPAFNETFIVQEFDKFKRQMFMMKKRNPELDLYQEFQGDLVLRQSFPAMNYMVGLGRIIPSSTASVERIFSTMNSLCTSSRSRMSQSLLDALMRTCTHEADSLDTEQLNSMVDKFRAMKIREITL